MSLLRKECIKKGQAYSQIPDTIYNLLDIGGSSNSGYENIKQLLHQYVSYN